MIRVSPASGREKTPPGSSREPGGGLRMGLIPPAARAFRAAGVLLVA